MDTFTSSALGSAYDYAASFSDQVWVVMAAKDLMQRDHQLRCRKVGTNDPFVEVLHNHNQCKIVLADMDAWLALK